MSDLYGNDECEMMERKKNFSISVTWIDNENAIIYLVAVSMETVECSMTFC